LISQMSTTPTLIDGFALLLEGLEPPAQNRRCKSEREAAAAALLAADSSDDHHTPPSPMSYTSTASQACSSDTLPPPHIIKPCCAPASSVHSMDDADRRSLGCDSCAVDHTLVMALYTSTAALAPLLPMPPAKHTMPYCVSAAAARSERGTDRADVLQVPVVAS
jgi:hypothetical protein